MPGLARAAEVARLAGERADDAVAAALAAHGLRLEAVRAAGPDRVAAWLETDGYRIAVPFVLAGDVERDAEAVLAALRERPPGTWDARWAGTTADTADVRPAIAGTRWRLLQGDLEA